MAFGRRTIELQCPKCGATMEWNELEGMKICKHCRYAAKEVRSLDFLRSATKQRAEEQREHAAEKDRHVGLHLFLFWGVPLLAAFFFAFAQKQGWI